MKQRGFIALVSAVIIAVVLLTLISGTGHRGFSSRLNILHRELKTTSVGLAEACVEVARLKLATNRSYNPNKDWLKVGDRGCEITAVTPVDSEFIILARATSAPIMTQTKLEVRISNAYPFSFTAWEERP